MPTVENVRALAAYGPTATLFTLGPNHTVQQYDLERPQMVATTQIPPLVVPPTPPDEDRQLGVSTSESEEDFASPIKRATMEMNAIAAARIDRGASISPRSNQSRTESYASLGSAAREGRLPYDPFSPMSSSEKAGTVFSYATQSQQGRPLHTSTTSYGSQSPVSTRSARKSSRLRQEVLPSPEDKPLLELFPYTRARLTDLPYRPPRSIDESDLTPDDLRRQMLSVVFGWDDDIHELIRDELSRHPVGSSNAALLSKWLNDDPDHLTSIMGAGGTTTSMDWMLLALSGIGNHDQAKKVAQAFVQKMLAKGDIHAAATILLAIGDRNDAVEVYVTRDHFMEAVLLTCLVMPADWQRQSYLVRKWGEHVVENSQQSLAIRCFSCTGVEPSAPWTSPSAQMMSGKNDHRDSGPDSNFSFAPHQRSMIRTEMPEAPTPVAMPAPPTPLQPPGPGIRMTAKNSALKLITTFGSQPGPQFRFPGLKSDDRTPTNAPGVTPIAESAIGSTGSALSPGGFGSYKSNNAHSIGSALASRTATPGGFRRQRLPSIGETPIDVHPPILPAPKPLPTPDNSGSDKEKESSNLPQNAEVSKSDANGPILLTSARYDPSGTPARETPNTPMPTTTIKLQSSQSLRPTHGGRDESFEESLSRRSSRTRKPEHLTLQDLTADAIANQSRSDLISPSNTSQSYQSAKSPSVSGRSTDQYISSLDEAYYYSRHQRNHRHTSKDRKGGADSENRERKRSKNRNKSRNDSRGRDAHTRIQPSKRSPSSPIPMSPEDLRMYSASVESFDSAFDGRSSAGPSRTREKSQPRVDKALVQTEPYTIADMPSRAHTAEGHKRSKPTSRNTSRQQSPNGAIDSQGRSRNRSRREGPALRSPSSPVPMSPSGEDVRKHSDVESSLRIVSGDRQRLQSQPRSHSRRAERSTSARRDASPDRRRPRNRSASRQGYDGEGGLVKKSGRHRDASTDGPPVTQWSEPAEPYQRASSHPQFTSDESEYRSSSVPHSIAERRKREIAAAELEARRLSLARRPSAPIIPMPGVATHSKSASTDAVHVMPSGTDSLSAVASSFAYRMQAKTSPNEANFSDSNSSGNGSSGRGRPGLPSTPRAMRHPRYNTYGSDPDVPAVPDVPDNLMQLNSDGRRPSISRAMSAPIQDMGPAVNEVPADLPAHPAYNARLPRSRSNSRSRAFSPARREPSRERRISPREIPSSYREPPSMMIGKINTSLSTDNPPLLPELQHLHSPPPPPPPPLQVTPQSAGTISIGFEGPDAIIDVRPGTAPLSAIEPKTSSSHLRRNSGTHRRGRSVNENNHNVAGKFRALTDRMRSTSRGRNTKSPPTSGGENNPSPYESLAPPKAYDIRRVELPSQKV